MLDSFSLPLNVGNFRFSFFDACTSTASVTSTRPPMERVLGISWKKIIWDTMAMKMAEDLSTMETGPAFSNLRARVPRVTFMTLLQPIKSRTHQKRV